MAKRVLIVDDHAPTRALIRAVLEAEKTDPYECVDAATGMDAIKTFDQKGPFDIVLLDVQLPDMDGFAVCQALRRVDKEIPVVFVTGKNDLKDYQAGRDVGGDSYLVKPISRGALRSIVGLFTKIARKAGREGGAGP